MLPSKLINPAYSSSIEGTRRSNFLSRNCLNRLASAPRNYFPVTFQVANKNIQFLLCWSPWCRVSVPSENCRLRRANNLAFAWRPTTRHMNQMSDVPDNLSNFGLISPFVEYRENRRYGGNSWKRDLMPLCLPRSPTRNIRCSELVLTLHEPGAQDHLSRLSMRFIRCVN